MQRHGNQAPLPVTPEAAFAKALREIRLERGVSQENLGFESGYHRTYISMLDRGKVNPSLRTSLSLPAVLDVPAVEIIRRVEANRGKSWHRPEKLEPNSPRKMKRRPP